MSMRELINLIEAKLSRHSTSVPDRIAALKSTAIGKYLFHGTNIQNLPSILSSNSLSTGINWREEGNRVSLTRNYAVAKDFGTYGLDEEVPAVLILDWAKLASNYKIYPYNDTQPDSEELRSNPFSTDGTEEEEAVYGEIKPLSKYLVSINVEPGICDKLAADTNWLEGICAEWDDISPRNLSTMMLKVGRSPLLNRVHF